ncbi:MAG: urease accessory protein UreG, partial [Mycobacterium sp.]
RKGGPGITRADLLVINKTDLACYVEVDVEQMLVDARLARQGALVLALSRNLPESIDQLVNWVLGLRGNHVSGAHTPIDPGPMAPHSHTH